MAKRPQIGHNFLGLGSPLPGLFWSAVLIVFIFMTLFVTMSARAKQTSATMRYADDTHRFPTGIPVIKVVGDQRLKRYQLRAVPNAGPVTIDARRAIFTVSNSKNSRPSAEFPCKFGTEEINPYPLNVYGRGQTTIVGGLFRSKVPQLSDWEPTYCNSAAILFKDSPMGTVDGVRIEGAWDAVRSAARSPNLLLKNSWISAVRDDAVENDYLYSARIEDTLLDGVFQGISVKASGHSELSGAGSLVTLSGVLMRLREYPYKGRQFFGAPSKNDERAPQLRVHNSVIAIDYRGGSTWPAYWTRNWSNIIDAENNLLLWLSDEPVPSTFPLPPAGFTVVKGSAARALWEKSRSNWINCHPKIARFPKDMSSDPRACQANIWGGFTH